MLLRDRARYAQNVTQHVPVIRYMVMVFLAEIDFRILPLMARCALYSVFILCIENISLNEYHPLLTQREIFCLSDHYQMGSRKLGPLIGVTLYAGPAVVGFP